MGGPSSDSYVYLSLLQQPQHSKDKHLSTKVNQILAVLNLTSIKAFFKLKINKLSAELSRINPFWIF